MYIITEQNIKHKTTYLKEYFDDNSLEANPILSEIIQVRYQNVIYDGHNYHLLYDSNMNILYDATNYLNFDCNGLSPNTIAQHANALCILYSYLSIYSLNYEELTIPQAKDYIEFLRGTSTKGLLFTTRLSTQRSNSTISGYLKVYRRFAKYLNITDHSFLKKAIHQPNQRQLYEGYITPQYNIRVKTETQNEVPKYISVPEYRKLMNSFDTSDITQLGDRIICRLMFEHGGRLGESLGLTLEDIGCTYKPDGTLNHYFVDFRNRLSDSKLQKAKTAMNVSSTSDYTRPEYNKGGIGYNRIVLNHSTATELLDYISQVDSINDQKYRARRDIFSCADSVPSANPIAPIEKNYYVFLNIWGRPLSQDSFNTHLRKHYTEIGIPIDTKKRENNLGYRLRHGFAMYLEKELHMDPMAIKALMRHKHFSTTEIYLNPTQEDTNKLLESLIPEIEGLFLGDE